MDISEKMLTSEYVYNGKIMDVRKDEVLVSNGNKSYREVVEHSGAVVVLANNNGKIPFVKQYRYPINQSCLELPAGKLEKNENPFDAAKRELEEETGYIADNWVSLGYIYSSPGFCDEKLYLYYATELKYTRKNFDEDEVILNCEYTPSEIFEMIDNGEITDAKTMCAIFKARKYIND